MTPTLSEEGDKVRGVPIHCAPMAHEGYVPLV
jgi:hypothetical protein